MPKSVRNRCCPSFLALYDPVANRPVGRCQFRKWVGHILGILINRIVAVRLRCLSAEDVKNRFSEMSIETIRYLNKNQLSGLKALVVTASDGTPTLAGQALLRMYKSCFTYSRKSKFINKEMVGQLVTHLGDTQKAFLVQHENPYEALSFEEATPIYAEALSRVPSKASDYTTDLFTIVKKAESFYHMDYIAGKWSSDQQEAFFQKLPQLSRVYRLINAIQDNRRPVDAIRDCCGRLVGTILSAPAEAESKGSQADSTEAAEAKARLIEAFTEGLRYGVARPHLDPKWLADMAEKQYLNRNELLQILTPSTGRASESLATMAPFFATIFAAWGKSIQDNEPAETVMKQFASSSFEQLNALYVRCNFPFKEGRTQHKDRNVERGQAYLLRAITETAQTLFDKDPNVMKEFPMSTELFAAIAKSFKAEDYAKIPWTTDLIYHGLAPEARKKAFAALSDRDFANIFSELTQFNYEFLRNVVSDALIVDALSLFLERYREPGRDAITLNRIVHEMHRQLSDKNTIAERSISRDGETPGLRSLLEQCFQLPLLPVPQKALAESKRA
ncbi:MAG: hypothetical protein H0X51_06860 [Parachlamydiaceae bacterium]|nr:hypothetical protein [Parachlamydiaceae bacterium]